jgi:large subunit ribosomal protein L24
MNKLRKGDDVIIIAGKDKNKRGVVQARLSSEYLMIEGLNVSKKHLKPNPNKGVTGGITDQTMPIHQSNVAILNKVTNKADRVGVKTLEDGVRVRIYKSTGDVINTNA